MGMLKKDTKKSLTRGAKIQVDNTIDRLEFMKKVNPISTKDKSNTFRVSAKIDNHTRNKLQTLVILGYANSIAELIKDLTNAKVERLKDSESERFNFLYETYELQDSKKQK